MLRTGILGGNATVSLSTTTASLDCHRRGLSGDSFGRGSVGGELSHRFRAKGALVFEGLLRVRRTRTGAEFSDSE